MKTSLRKYLSLVMVLCVAFVCLFGVSVKAATVIESVDFTTKAAKHTSYTDTWAYDDWTVSGGANNNGGWAYVRMGGKKDNLAKYNDIYIASPQVASATSKVTVNVVSGSGATSSRKATMGLYVYSDSSYSNQVDYIGEKSVTSSAELFEFEPTNGVSWPSNSYFKVVFTCTNTTTTNGIVWLNNVSIYDYNAGDALLPSIEIEGGNYTEVEDVVTLKANTANTTGNVVWTSSNTTVATVDQNGNVTAKAMGTTTITATVDGVSAELLFTVFPTDGSELTIAEALQVCELTGATNCAFTYSTTGVIASIDTAYDAGYGNITVTITDGTNSIKAFRMAGGEELAEGDKITVTGTLVNYNGHTPEFIAGCTYVAVEDDATEAIRVALNDVAAYMSLGFKYTTKQVAAPAFVEFVAADLGYENGVAVESLEEGLVNITFDKGANSNAPKYYTTGEAIRCYGGNSMTFTSNGTNITSIELTFASGEGTNAITADCGTFDTDTWTGSSNSVVLTIGGTTGHRRIATIKVSYEGGSSVTVTEYSDVDFRIRCGVDYYLADIEGVDSYGIKVSTAGKEVYYNEETATSWGSDEDYLYVTIALGDILTTMSRSSVEFTVTAYVVVDGVTYESESSKTYSVAGLVSEYYNGSDETIKNTVASLYDLYDKEGLFA